MGDAASVSWMGQNVFVGLALRKFVRLFDVPLRSFSHSTEDVIAQSFCGMFLGHGIRKG